MENLEKIESFSFYKIEDLVKISHIPRFLINELISKKMIRLDDGHVLGDDFKKGIRSLNIA